MRNSSPWGTAAGLLRRVGPLAALVVLTLVVAAVAPHRIDALPAAGLAFAAFSGVIMDSTAEFCDATALNTGGAGSYLIGNVMDLSKVRDIGSGRQVYLVISVDTAVDSAGDGVTLKFSLASDAQAAIATNGTATIHYASAVLAQATLVPGFQLVVPVPLENPAYEQYLGILQTTAVEAVTAGKVNAYLTLDPPAWKSYPQSANSLIDDES